MSRVAPEALALDRPSVAFLYKYSSAEHLDWLRTILIEHQLYFPSPPQLNDPTDARPRMAVSSKAGALRTLVNAYLIAHRWDPPADLARHVRIMMRIVESRNLDQLGDWITPAFHKEMNEHRIYSMTTRSDNVHLWEHYAGNHTGYCLEFHNRGLFGYAHHVIYGDAVELDFSEPETIDAVFLFRKTYRYEPEEEVRILLLPRGKPHEVPFEPTLLRRVILGKHMTEENRRLIRDWCAMRVPAVAVVEESELFAVSA